MSINKYALIVILLLGVLLGGYVLRLLRTNSSGVVPETGITVEITVYAKKDNWRWEPENIKLEAGDRIKMTVINEDEYDHGIAIDGYGINQRTPANAKITFEFLASRRGRFSFYCSVPCGKGIVEGEERGHFDMVGFIDVE